MCNIFALSPKERRDEVDFLNADRQQTIVQVDTIKLGGHGQAPPPKKIPKTASLENLCNILRKKWGIKLIFCTGEYQNDQ